jgi:diguanylate cyclase (GGDEF)-like protein
MAAMKYVTPSTAFRSGKSGLPNLDNFDYEHTATRQTDTNVSPHASTRRTPARPVLTIVEGADAGRVVPIEKTEVIIGRGADCGVVLPDTGVSRRHARVVVREHDFLLEDLQSKNGTFVDGATVTSRSLAVGDVFHVGPNVKIRLSMMDQSEERLARQLYDSSMRDALTGVFNRRYYVQRLVVEVAYAARHRTALSVVMVDLDHFKKVNDTFGHIAGDRLLQAVARAVASSLRSEDVLARVGGEEFALLLRATDQREAKIVAERVRAAVAATSVAIGQQTVSTTVSGGVASTSDIEGPPTHEALLALADDRLYAAKAAGRNVVRGR